MAVAELIGAAVGVLLLVIVAYLLVGGTLSTAETVTTAQKDITLLNEARMRTSMTITDSESQGSKFLNFSVRNTGSEPITDLVHMDVFSYDENYHYLRYTYIAPAYDVGYHPLTWTTRGFEYDTIHKGELDPGVKMEIKLNLPDSEYEVVNPPIIIKNIQVTTGNGVSAFSAIS